MEVTITLDPELGEALQRRAQADGLVVEEYARSLLERAFQADDPGRSGGGGRPRPTLEEFERDWDLFSQGTENWPVLSDEDLSREVIYGDHD
jgi:hypothetical protein